MKTIKNSSSLKGSPVTHRPGALGGGLAAASRPVPQPLPVSVARLPSRQRLAKMSKGARAQTFVFVLYSCAFEIEGLRGGRFAPPQGMTVAQRVRNARRRCNRAIDRALEFNLWKDGRLQMGTLWVALHAAAAKQVRED